MSQISRTIGIVLPLLLVATLLLPGAANAHRLRPAVVTITLNTDQTVAVQVDLNVEALLAGIGPEHEDTSDAPNAAEYDTLRSLRPAQLQSRIREFAPRLIDGIELVFDDRPAKLSLLSADVPEIGDIERDRITTIRLSGTTPQRSQNVTWRYAEPFGSSVVRISRANEPVVQSAFLNPGIRSEPFAIGEPMKERSGWDTTRNYIWIGFTHIVPKGLDHILFVLGIFLLAVRWRPLLYQVTAFTIAHTITLGLSLYGYVSLDPGIVEPLIAASIVYVGIENIVTPTLKPWRIVIVFCFGLLHGMGFAGVLTDIGLPENEFVNALISFNVGVELGQLTVIAGAFLLVGAWFRKRDWYRSRVIIPASAFIACIGAYWAFERVFLG